MDENIDDSVLVDCIYVKMGKNRTKAMQSLKNGDVKIPTQIAKDVDIRTNHISKVLSELKEKNLVECINEEVRKGRLYRLTDHGKEVAKHLDKEF